MEDVSEYVDQGVEQEQVVEQPMEEVEQLIEPPTPDPPARVRKVRVRAPTDAPAAPDPNYWSSRLQEHRSSQRLAKDERYGNLRIM